MRTSPSLSLTAFRPAFIMLSIVEYRISHCQIVQLLSFFSGKNWKKKTCDKRYDLKFSFCFGFSIECNSQSDLFEVPIHVWHVSRCNCGRWCSRVCLWITKINCHFGHFKTCTHSHHECPLYGGDIFLIIYGHGRIVCRRRGIVTPCEFWTFEKLQHVFFFFSRLNGNRCDNWLPTEQSYLSFDRLLYFAD